MPAKLNLPYKEIKEMYQDGASSREIADVYGCHYTTICKALKKMNFPVRRNATFRRRKIMIPEERESLAYFAGILDGEGSVGFSRAKGAKDEKAPFVTIANTSLALMEWLKRNFGYDYERKLGKRYGATRIWQWRVRRIRDVITLLEAVKSYLIIKHEDAERMLTYLREKIAKSY